MRRPRQILIALLAIAPVGFYLACGDDDNGATVPGSDGGSSSADGTDTTNDTGTAVTLDGDIPGIVRGPVSLDFDPSGNGDPISLVWDDGSKTLFIADNRNNQLWTWKDGAGSNFTKLTKIPDDPIATDSGSTNLGQIVRLSDGTLVVPRFGFGSRGAIVYTNPQTSTSGTVPGLPLTNRRVALTRGTGDEMWGGYFTQTTDSGVVTKVSLTGETDYAGGFQKPVAVIVLNNQLIVSEQTRGLIYALPLTGATAPYTVYATVPSPDSLTLGPGDSIITGQFKPLSDGGPLQLRQIFTDGGYQVIEADAGLSKPQGVAYDKTNKRLFVADSNGTTIRIIKILPLE